MGARSKPILSPEATLEDRFVFCVGVVYIAHGSEEIQNTFPGASATTKSIFTKYSKKIGSTQTHRDAREKSSKCRGKYLT